MSARWPRSTSTWTTSCRRSSRGRRSTACWGRRSRNEPAAGGGGAPAVSELGRGSRVPRPLGAARRAHGGGVAAVGPHLVRRPDRARLQQGPRGGRRQAPGRQGRLARGSGRRHLARGGVAGAAAGPLSGVLERRRPRWSSDRGRLRLQGEVTASELVLPTAGRWLGLVALAAVVGGFALDLQVLPRDAPELTKARRRLRRWVAVAVAVLGVTTAGDLVGRARVMSGGDLSQAMAALPAVLTRMHFGTIWIARAMALALLAVASASRAAPARAAGFVLSLGIVLTSSLTGHAADRGDSSLSVLVDWLHAVAATAWTGGLFGLVLVARRNHPAWPPALLGVVAQRFSRLAGY